VHAIDLFFLNKTMFGVHVCEWLLNDLVFCAVVHVSLRILIFFFFVCLCVCVCVCERERERENQSLVLHYFCFDIQFCRSSSSSMCFIFYLLPLFSSSLSATTLLFRPPMRFCSYPVPRTWLWVNNPYIPLRGWLCWKNGPPVWTKTRRSVPPSTLHWV
jgi:hypothetical protein